ncbi:TlyA family RNA methyltransferase [Clostridium hydrogeniformans]|uniref:TlyA family RNA methyltransferase n=1 Tax=Clostridium hydrogeniformans TaxID=349933 RepID=UPI00068A4878|nr:TlyA family RNA methyltransferase [Clostridium hydrogeniformans]
MKKQKKCLLIDKLIQDGWFENEHEAMPWVMARQVLVNDQPAKSCKEKIAIDSIIRVRKYYKKTYVNKGGFKLEGAIKDFGIDVKNKIALDCGASTGGFTDFLISNGAANVYAVDVGYGQLAGKLAINPKIVNLERTNLSDPSLCMLDPIPEIITLDLSYLSLAKALPICKNIFRERPGIVICLVKPLFEVESSMIRRTGKINDKVVFYDVLKSLCNNFIEQNLSILGITNSPITGNNGTLEYFIEVELNGEGTPILANNIDKCIENTIDRSFQIDKFKKDNFQIDNLNQNEEVVV